MALDAVAQPIDVVVDSLKLADASISASFLLYPPLNSSSGLSPKSSPPPGKVHVPDAGPGAAWCTSSNRESPDPAGPDDQRRADL